MDTGNCFSDKEIDVGDDCYFDKPKWKRHSFCTYDKFQIVYYFQLMFPN